MARKEKTILLSILNDYMDDIMFEKTFKRKKNSKIYQRKNSEALQKVDFDYQVRPYYNRSAIIRIYPNLNIYFEKLQNEIDRVFEKYDYIPLLGRPIHDNFTICQRVEFYGNLDRWFVCDENNYIDVANKIKTYFLEKTIPFLESCNSIDGFINTYEKTNLIAIDHRIVINLIIAYFLKDNKEKAVALLEDKFNKKELQDIYRPLYDRYY